MEQYKNDCKLYLMTLITITDTIHSIWLPSSISILEIKPKSCYCICHCSLWSVFTIVGKGNMLKFKSFSPVAQNFSLVFQFTNSKAQNLYTDSRCPRWYVPHLFLSWSYLLFVSLHLHPSSHFGLFAVPFVSLRG